MAKIDQHLVTGLVAPTVIDRPKIVDIKQQQGQLLAFGPGPDHFPFANGQKGDPIGQACYRADMGQAPQLQLPHHQFRQQPQLVNLGGRGQMGLLVQHTYGAQVVASGTGERGPGIKTQMGFSADQGIGAEALIIEGIGHHQHPF